MPTYESYSLTLTDGGRAPPSWKARARRYTSSYSEVGARQDRALRRPPTGWATTRIAARLEHSTPPSGIKVAQNAFFDERPGRPDRSASGGGRPPEFSPLTSWSPSRALGLRIPPATAFRSLPQPAGPLAVPRPWPAAAVESGIVRPQSPRATTIWALAEVSDAIQAPGQHRSWIFPRDPDFGARAARVARPLRSPIRRPARLRARRSTSICADEKTLHLGPAIPANTPTQHPPAAETGPARVEDGVLPPAAPLAYLAAWERAPRQGVRPLRSPPPAIDPPSTG